VCVCVCGHMQRSNNHIGVCVIATLDLWACIHRTLVGNEPIRDQTAEISLSSYPSKNKIRQSQNALQARSKADESRDLKYT